MSQHLSLPKAIIFDLNGTIITTGDYEHIVRALVISHQYGSIDQTDENIIRSIAGLGRKEVAAIVTRHFTLPYTVFQLEDYLWDAIRKEITFIKGFEKFFAFLKSHNIEVAIATNLNRETLNEYTNKLGLDEMFGTHIYSYEDAGRKVKPDPALFTHAADMLGMLPLECIVFEDSERGFLAAKAAGMKCIALRKSYNQAALAYVDAVVDDFDEAILYFS